MAQEYPFLDPSNPSSDEPLEVSDAPAPAYAKDEETAAEKSACVIVGVIFVVLVLIAAGVWYYLANRKLPEENGKTAADPNFVAASKGGRVSAYGFDVIIPPGALKQDTKIEIEKVEPGEVTDLYRLKPEGLKFNKVVTLAIPYKENGLKYKETPYDIDLEYWSDVGEGFDRLLRYSVDAQEKKLHAQVTEF